MFLLFSVNFYINFHFLQAVTVLKIKPEIEEGCLESSSAEQQGRTLVESGVKGEPGEIEGCVRLLFCVVVVGVFLLKAV